MSTRRCLYADEIPQNSIFHPAVRKRQRDGAASAQYAYGFEPRPDQGWLQFPWEGYTVWIDTGSRDLEVYDPGNVGIDTDDLILIEDEQIVNENMVIQYKQWSDMLNAELRG